MSINHYSSEIPETQWWSLHHRATMDSSPKTTSSSSSNNHHHKASDDNSASFWLSPHQLYSTASAGGAMFCRQNAAAAGGFDLNNNNEDEDGDAVTTKDSVVEKSELGGIIPKDRLFEKPLTPSDVGKLNRLVIPKQHAEKHFPLNGGGGDSGESGLLLGFEDEVGKAWRFRYSYWNSSQSYVLTKGWSRFVKEKRLDAGDIVVFARHRVDSGRLFIGWRRRNSTAAAGQDAAAASQPAAPSSGTPSGGAGGVWNRAAAFYSAQPYPISRGQYQITPSSPLPNHSLHPGSVPVVQKQTTGSGNPKRLRLFGVNMECQLADDVSDPSTPVMSTQGHPHHPYHNHHHYNHMDISFSGGNDDVYRQG
ncbi:hypothetical protein ABFS82_10G057900 [Erythranthe guttata]|uniref:B3 domain-containing protein At2g36080 n=1 Tax=Erythranthe guttata TaxID=4155 RepID=UPI00064D9589|nr:PREDICTED: B3 domain-containing protein At2g36080 [Erythranthe guttata]|eukprot:XP_012828697.1 PREDICTED: B3 domain-containing protein At2g36080 [Erythranthe guttata]